MILRPSLFRSIQNFGLAKVNFSSKPPNELVFFMNDMAVCWHPEPTFPYECSKPLPKVDPVPESVLKVDVSQIYKTYGKEPTRAAVADELAKMTYTTKHLWFNRARDKKAKKTKPDRPYL